MLFYVFLFIVVSNDFQYNFLLPFFKNVEKENRLEFFQNAPSTFNITLLMRAIYVDGSRVIDKLLELGVDINCQVEANGNLTAIMLAIECNNLPTVRRLLESDTPVLLSAQVKARFQKWWLEISAYEIDFGAVKDADNTFHRTKNQERRLCA